MKGKVGNNSSGIERVMGKHGLGSIRDGNGERLIELCNFNGLVITGTLFPHKDKQTWVSPDGKTVNQIDHTRINTKFRPSVMDTRAFRSADMGSNHYLVRTTIKLKLCKVDERK